MRNPETNPFSLFFKTISKHYPGVIAIVLVGSACYIWLSGKTVPNTLENLTYMVVSFLFGKSIGEEKAELKKDD